MSETEREIDPIKAKLRNMEKRHRHNRKVGAEWFAFVVGLILIMAVINFVSPSVYADATVPAFFVFLIGSILIARNLRTITNEEHAVESLTSALSAIDEYQQGPEPEQLELAAKSIRSAGGHFSTFGSGSAIYSEAFGIHKNVRDALRNKLPYLLTQTNGPSTAEEKIVRLRSILLNPALESLRAWANDSAGLEGPPKPPPRRINWSQVTERRAGQLAISTVAAIVLPLLFLGVYTLAGHLDASAVARDNFLALLTAAITIFLGVLNWLARK